MDLFHKELLRQSVIHADETTVQVLKEPGKAPTAESRMWVYASTLRSDHQIRYFEYQPGRSGDYAEEFLQGYDGILETDGYSGYNKVQTASCPRLLLGTHAAVLAGSHTEYKRNNIERI